MCFPRKSITAKLIDLTIWVHKSDIDGDGRVYDADYCLFKLQQLQALDTDILRRLQARFSNLDSGVGGELRLGFEVPSADQVKRLQAIQKERASSTIEKKEGNLPTLMALWKEHRSELIHDQLDKSPRNAEAGFVDVPSLKWLMDDCNFEATVAKKYAASLAKLGYHYKVDFLFFGTPYFSILK